MAVGEYGNIGRVRLLAPVHEGRCPQQVYRLLPSAVADIDTECRLARLVGHMLQLLPYVEDACQHGRVHLHPCDLRKDKRIDFVGGIRGLGELKRRVDSGEMKMALALYPVSMKQLMDIADTGNIMPPKTTWFEPKLRSGLVIHKLV